MTLLIFFGAVCLGVVALWLLDGVLVRQSQRRQAHHHALRAAWRIHQIVGSARQQMWDEASHHRETGT